MKKTHIMLLLSSLSLGLCYAEETIEVNLTPLTTAVGEDGWQAGHNGTHGTENPVVNTETQTISISQSNWSQSYASLALGTLTGDVELNLTDRRDTLTFTYVMDYGSSTDVAATFTIIGNNNTSAVILGHGTYNTVTIDETSIPASSFQVGYASTTVDGGFAGGKNFFQLKDNNNTTKGSILSNESGVVSTGTRYEISGTLTGVNGMTANLVLEVKSAVDTYTVNVGNITISSISGLAFSFDGPNTAGGTPTFSNLKVQYKHVPEPATATLSLLALAGLCTRRRRK